MHARDSLLQPSQCPGAKLWLALTRQCPSPLLSAQLAALGIAPVVVVQPLPQAALVHGGAACTRQDEAAACGTQTTRGRQTWATQHEGAGSSGAGGVTAKHPRDTGGRSVAN